ncbi:phage portal protein [Peterkaempfera griseoplana]|uniref:phage portal protein n=1 Tax=Peterkaempfera griseoplana TaxID=66896 RepID=UPI0006E17A9B|nr:phage portal protein [Peterkaempfera griseoplana]
MGLSAWWQRLTGSGEVLEKASAVPARLPDRTGFEYGIGPSGLTEWNQGIGAGSGTDRRSALNQLYDAYLACPWAWACVNAIARTITAGGLVMEWDPEEDTEQEQPPKPAEVRALERMLGYCNPSESIIKILRGVIADLLVFGDAYLEVVWVGRQPVALYSLDCPSMHPETDEHGQVTRYVQVTELGQRATFEPREVIHISLDSPRSSIFGVSPTQAALLPITAWLYASATSKELFKKGNPPTLHVDMPASASVADMNRWQSQFMVRNVGSRNIGAPVMTKGGGKVQELNSSRTVDYLKFLDQKRDEIIACYGVPPAKAGIIESGNLGGGTGEEQDKTFMVNTCGPLAELVLEALNWHLGRLGFGVDGWTLRFKDVDLRDSKKIEEIRDMRLKNGAWTLNRYRGDINELPVDGGDQAVLVDRSHLVRWQDMERMSDASIAAAAAPAVSAGVVVPGVELEPEPEPAPVPPHLAPFAGQPPETPGPDDAPDDDTDEPPAESHRARFRARLAEALRTLPGGVDERHDRAA